MDLVLDILNDDEVKIHDGKYVLTNPRKIKKNYNTHPKFLKGHCKNCDILLSKHLGKNNLCEDCCKIK